MFTLLIISAVGRGGAGGARAPPVFSLKSKNKMLKIKINIIRQLFGKFSKNDLPMKSTFATQTV